MSHHWRLLLFVFILCLLMVASCSATLFQDLQGTEGSAAQTGSGMQALNTGPSENFTVVVLPDTQFCSESYPTIFDNQTQWIANEAGNLNVVFVTHEGDIVNQDLASQWQKANHSLSKLDGQVPWGVLPGNHDFAANGSLTNYNTFFGYSRFGGKSWYGGHYSNDNANNYELFSGGGDNYLIFHFQYHPTDAVLAWANSTLAGYPDRRVIVVTHDYLNVDGTRTTEGNHIWSGFVAPHADQVMLVLCGHNHGEARRSDTVNGFVIPQLLADYQSGTNGGNGFLRILKFSPALDKIYVSTFSPYLNSYDNNANSQFTLDYDMSGGFLVNPQFPDDGLTTVDNMPDFKFTVVHPTLVMFNCSLWLQNGMSSKVYASGVAVNASVTTLTPSSIVPNGVWQWWINCTGGSLSGVSEKRNITINVFRGEKTFTSTYDGSMRTYWLDLPDNFDVSAPTPLLFFLHGYHGSRLTYSSYTGLRQVFQNHTWIAAATDCRTANGYMNWYAEPSRRDITDVLNVLKHDYLIDASHVHVMGNSMGGGGALKYSMFNNQVIASVVDINGVTNFTAFYSETSTYKASLVASYGGTPSQVPAVYRNESALGNEQRFSHTAVMILHGTADDTISVSQSQNLNQSLSARGYVVNYVELPGVGHDILAVISGRELQIFNWLKDHPMWGNTHLMLSVQPNQDTYAKGQSLTLLVTAYNEHNQALDGILSLTISGAGENGHFDFQTVNVTANGIREYSFDWRIPDVAGTYVAEVGLVPAQLTAYDTSWIKVT